MSKYIFRSQQEGFLRVFENDHDVFFAPSKTGSGVLNVDLKHMDIACDIVQLPHIYLRLNTGMAFPKNSESQTPLKSSKTRS